MNSKLLARIKVDAYCDKHLFYGLTNLNDGFYDCKVYESHTSDPTDATWYMTCFENFKKRGDNIVYAASYHIPKKLLSE